MRLLFRPTRLQQHLGSNTLVIGTDLKAFYDFIDDHLLLDKVAVRVKHRFTLNLIWQSMHRCVESGGLCRDITQGLPHGAPGRTTALFSTTRRSPSCAETIGRFNHQPPCI
jgi:hypothetical protein